MSLSHRLRRARLEAAMTQERVAEQANLERNTIWRYEAGLREPSASTLHLLARIYGKPVAWFWEEGAQDAAQELGERLSATLDKRLGQMLRSAREEAGWSQQEAGRRAGVDPNMIYQYEAAHRNPSTLALRGLAALYGKPVEWFFRGEDEAEGRVVRLHAEAPASTTRPAPDPLLEASSTLDDKFRDVMTRLDRIESAVRTTAVAEPRAEYDRGGDLSTIRPVEVVEVAAAAGGGAEVYDETVVGRLWFRRDWLDRHSIDPAQCNVITVRGESMEPTLPDGCSVLVDRNEGRRRHRAGRIYVMRTQDGLVVKRAGQDEEGNWQVVSDHPGWETTPWSDDTEIIGEVRWMARGL